VEFDLKAFSVMLKRRAYNRRGTTEQAAGDRSVAQSVCYFV